MYLLEVEPLDLGADVKAIRLELTDPAAEEPVIGVDAARIWSRIFPALAGTEPWALDFFSHLDRVRDYCARHSIAYRDGSARSLVIPAPEAERLTEIFQRFERETFGARCGGNLPAGSNGGVDAALEGNLARQGVDAYHLAYPNYFFCAVCDFSDGSLVLLTNRLWVSEIVRRLGPVLPSLDVKIRVPAQN